MLKSSKQQQQLRIDLKYLTLHVLAYVYLTLRQTARLYKSRFT